MTKFVLFILDRLRGVFHSMGIDYAQLRVILEIKLLMDKRRKPAALTQSGTGKEENSSIQYWLSLFLYAVLGSVVGSLIFVMPSIFWALSIVFAYVMVMTIMTLITDFASVIMDTTDYAILSPRPVDSRTIWMARLIHVVVYVLTLTFAVALMPLIFTGIRYGVGASALFLLLVIFSAFLAVFFTSLLYVLLIRFTSEARLRQVITYAQVAFSFFFIAGYQILPRLITKESLQHISQDVVWWHYLAPPFWMGGIMEAVINRHFEWPYAAFAALALLFPMMVFYTMNGAVTRSFSRKLAEMSSADGSTTTEQVESVTGPALSERLSAWFTRHPIEKMGFELTWKITGRDQKFKLRTYPSLGVMIPTLFVFLRGDTLGAERWQYILVLYIFSLAINAFYTNSQFSDDYRAAWFYQSSPVTQPGYVLSGALKAIFLKYITPIYFLVGVFVLVIWGFGALGDIILAFLNNVLFILIFVLVAPKRFPFSHSSSQMQQVSNFGITLLMLMLSSMIGFAHFGLSVLPWAVWLAIPFIGLLSIYLLRQLEKISWQQIQEATA